MEGTGYERGRVRLELTFVTRDGAGRLFVPLRARDVLWSEEPFGNQQRELLGVRARVIPLPVLKSGKSSARDEPNEAAKDPEDFQALSSLSP